MLINCLHWQLCTATGPRITSPCTPLTSHVIPAMHVWWVGEEWAWTSRNSTFPKQGIYSQHVLLLGSLQTMTINNIAHAVLDSRFDSPDQVNDRGRSGLTEMGNLILVWSCMLTKHCNPSPFGLLSASCFWPLFRCPWRRWCERSLRCVFVG